MKPQRWTRQSAGSGPADTLDDRYEVVRIITGRWGVFDRARRNASSNGQLGRVYGYRTMREARQAAEEFSLRYAHHIADEIDRLERL